MPSTTNFGWTTPADTDLVKDGASAIRTLGNGIDTTLVDLKGGTTGQVLSKNSNSDMDFTWVAQDDSNAIQNAIVDAKGDLISATAADTPARLASSGVNGDVLTVDTSTATGLKWAAASSAFTKISSTTFTSQASQAFDNVFSSSYSSYLIVIEELLTSTAGNAMLFRFRYAGPTTQTTNYYGGYTGGSTTGSNFAGGGRANAADLQISTGVGTSSDQSLRGYVKVFGCSGSSKVPQITYQTGNGNSSSSLSGYRNSKRYFGDF